MRGCRSLTDKEIENILGVLNNKRDKALFLLGIRTGLRISELLSLQIGDVLEHGAVGAYVTVKKCNTKGKIASKTLPLTASAKAVLRDLLSDKMNDVENDKLPLFQSTQSQKAITRMQAHRLFKTAFNSLKLQGKLSTHCLRKSFAYRIHKAMGERIEMTQIALCHKSLSSTSSYISVDRNEVEKAIMGLG